MKKLSIMLIIFFSSISLLYCVQSMPKNLTSTHKLGINLNTFLKNNSNYTNFGDFMVRKKPKSAGNSWNYDLIVVGDNGSRIDRFLFRVYKNTSKKHIKDKTILKSYLENQFETDIFSVNNTDEKDLVLDQIVNDPINKYIDDDFEKDLIISDIIASDNKSVFIFFHYKTYYYIYLGLMNKEDRRSDSNDTETGIISDISDVDSDASSDTEIIVNKDGLYIEDSDNKDKNDTETDLLPADNNVNVDVSGDKNLNDENLLIIDQTDDKVLDNTTDEQESDATDDKDSPSSQSKNNLPDRDFDIHKEIIFFSREKIV